MPKLVKNCHRRQTRTSDRFVAAELTSVKADSPGPVYPRRQNPDPGFLHHRGQPVPIRKLRKPEWRPYFDRVGRALLEKRAAIEILSPQSGSEVQAEWLPLLGICYDARNDMVAVAVAGLRHMIRKPQHLVAEEDGGQLATLQIIDEDGLSHIVRLHDGPARHESRTGWPQEVS